MARVQVLNTHKFGVAENPIVVVECSSVEDAAFDADRSKKQAEKLKKQTGAAAVVVQYGAQFWVV